MYLLKFTDPNIDTRKNTWGSFTWSYLRLAEIYLNYAEACNEKACQRCQRSFSIYKQDTRKSWIR
ncbi:RagB/SusD family nutrient uptake outer membrane protein [Bacteroides ovatus]|uniref:RagB/SusD family nutrient uptake outer membrane protein n=1 Tax=Bacteroides ovatus TaxID=28116 RepID=UPI0035B19A71